MSIGLVFWILMLIWLVFGFFNSGAATNVGGVTFPNWGGHILLWFLLFLLGWGVFGFPIHS